MTNLPAKFVGHWEGNAEIIVVWAAGEKLPVSVDISSDGKVTGTVGDARIVDGQFSSNRTWIERWLNFKTDWIICGRLQGPLLAKKGVQRKGFTIPLNFVNGCLQGGVHSTGSQIGGAARMRLSAKGLKLEKKEPR